MHTLASSSLAHLRRHADHAGVLASGLCMIHCLLTPLLISAFPALLQWLPGDASFHRALAISILLVSTLAFLPGYRLHRRRSLLALVATGIALVAVVAWRGETLPHRLELAISIPGSLMLIAAHLANRSFCRSCPPCRNAASCGTTHL
ncbi:MAG: MerC domain-containing protein [Edaphobacter sp.]|uniref:MerC domain-containing protein n=1 Tax=Edaphobacter sp. TaxID=1934404 RepID=UPI00238BC26D|nr:MerC domain-containing protein [Edaphobacter sp.]MDE1176627.1 MerC domain-containing protein [Edaphobacter sp.]